MPIAARTRPAVAFVAAERNPTCRRSPCRYQRRVEGTSAGRKLQDSASFSGREFADFIESADHIRLDVMQAKWVPLKSRCDSAAAAIDHEVSIAFLEGIPLAAVAVWIAIGLSVVWKETDERRRVVAPNANDAAAGHPPVAEQEPTDTAEDKKGDKRNPLLCSFWYSLIHRMRAQ